MFQVSVFADPTNKVLKGTKTDNFSEEFLKNKILVTVPLNFLSSSLTTGQA
jgi:hypothetical protein